MQQYVQQPTQQNQERKKTPMHANLESHRGTLTLFSLINHKYSNPPCPKSAHCRWKLPWVRCWCVCIPGCPPPTHRERSRFIRPVFHLAYRPPHLDRRDCSTRHMPQTTTHKLARKLVQVQKVSLSIRLGRWQGGTGGENQLRPLIHHPHDPADS